jgi:glycerophosphoryl diester phosphodiesterase
MPAPVPEPFPEPFQIIAHRGASARAPENTLAAFRAARDLGIVEVELDVQLSADDRVVLFHDADLERKTGRRGRVRDYPLEALVAFDIGSWFDRARPVAERAYAGTTLDPLEALFAELGPRLFYHVELKDGEPALPGRVLALVDRYALRDRVLITSFRFDQLERVRRLAPELPTCLLVARAEDREGSLADWIDRAAAAGMREVGVVASELRVEHVMHARARGLWIRAWGVKTVDHMDHAIAVGSNGMTLDWPERLVRRRLEAGGTPGAR